jgi:hypothetical protein
VATLLEPATTPSGATMELPQPTHNRKPASTTLRNATGERATPTRPGTRTRWRAPAIVGGVALVAAIAVLVILRGTGGGDRHDDAESTSAATSSSTTSRPVIAAPDEPKIARPIARPPEAKPPSAEPGTPTVEPAKPQLPVAKPVETSRPAIEANDVGAGPRKVTAKSARGKGAVAKSGRPKKSGAAPQETPAETTTDDDTTRSTNGAPIIK